MIDILTIILKFAIQNEIHREAWTLPERLGEIKNLRPTQNQKAHFLKNPRQLIYTLKFRKHFST